MMDQSPRGTTLSTPQIGFLASSSNSVGSFNSGINNNKSGVGVFRNIFPPGSIVNVNTSSGGSLFNSNNSVGGGLINSNSSCGGGLINSDNSRSAGLVGENDSESVRFFDNRFPAPSVLNVNAWTPRSVNQADRNHLVEQRHVERSRSSPGNARPRSSSPPSSSPQTRSETETPPGFGNDDQVQRQRTNQRHQHQDLSCNRQSSPRSVPSPSIQRQRSSSQPLNQSVTGNRVGNKQLRQQSSRVPQFVEQIDQKLQVNYSGPGYPQHEPQIQLFGSQSVGFAQQPVDLRQQPVVVQQQNGGFQKQSVGFQQQSVGFQQQSSSSRLDLSRIVIGNFPRMVSPRIIPFIGIPGQNQSMNQNGMNQSGINMNLPSGTVTPPIHPTRDQNHADQNMRGNRMLSPLQEVSEPPSGSKSQAENPGTPPPIPDVPEELLPQTLKAKLQMLDPVSVETYGNTIQNFDIALGEMRDYAIMRRNRAERQWREREDAFQNYIETNEAIGVQARESLSQIDAKAKNRFENLYTKKKSEWLGRFEELNSLEDSLKMKAQELREREEGLIREKEAFDKRKWEFDCKKFQFENAKMRSYSSQNSSAKDTASTRLAKHSNYSHSQSSSAQDSNGRTYSNMRSESKGFSEVSVSEVTRRSPRAFSSPRPSPRDSSARDSHHNHADHGDNNKNYVPDRSGARQTDFVRRGDGFILQCKREQNAWHEAYTTQLDEQLETLRAKYDNIVETHNRNLRANQALRVDYETKLRENEFKMDEEKREMQSERIRFRNAMYRLEVQLENVTENARDKHTEQVHEIDALRAENDELRYRLDNREREVFNETHGYILRKVVECFSEFDQHVFDVIHQKQNSKSFLLPSSKQSDETDQSHESDQHHEDQNNKARIPKSHKRGHGKTQQVIYRTPRTSPLRHGKGKEATRKGATRMASNDNGSQSTRQSQGRSQARLQQSSLQKSRNHRSRSHSKDSNDDQSKTAQSVQEGAQKDSQKGSGNKGRDDGCSRNDVPNGDRKLTVNPANTTVGNTSFTVGNTSVGNRRTPRFTPRKSTVGCQFARKKNS